MLDGILIGARIAFTDYPGVKQLRAIQSESAQKIHDSFWLRLAELADIDTRKRIEQAKTDAEQVANIIFGKLIIVDEFGTVHAQNGYSYTRWKREIEPIAGSGKDATSICGVHGAMRETKYDDYVLDWCPRCWPKVRGLLEKYRAE